jgi:hypothetical protein
LAYELEGRPRSRHDVLGLRAQRVDRFADQRMPVIDRVVGFEVVVEPIGRGDEFERHSADSALLGHSGEGNFDQSLSVQIDYGVQYRRAR